MTLIFEDENGLADGAYYRDLAWQVIDASLENEHCPYEVQLSLTLTDPPSIHRMNREYRGIDSETDVLSFPQNELLPGAFRAESCEIDPENGAVFLGDMVLSLERCLAQSEEYGHSFAREVSYLTVHSVLHLLGYDHLDEGKQKQQMRAREDVIMARLGL